MERLEAHQKQSINKYSEEEYSGSSKFEKIQEQCVQNKEKVDKYSKILTTILTGIIFLFIYNNFWDQTWIKILLGIIGFIYFILYLLPLGIFTLLLGISYENGRIHSKYPTILTIILILLITLFTNWFSFGFSAKWLLESCVSVIFIWIVVFSIHGININILDTNIFPNPKLTYTAKIVDIRSFKDKKKKTYFVHFYDYTTTTNHCDITEKEYNTWKKGDVIEVVLQPTINEIKAESIKRLENFEGLTDMEKDQLKHKKDIELFGQSQKEMDAIDGDGRSTSLNLYYFYINIFNVVIFVLNNNILSDIYRVMSNSCIYTTTSLIALAITIITSYIEYSKIKAKYTLEDIYIWTDHLLYRSFYFFITIFLLIGEIITIYLFIFS